MNLLKINGHDYSGYIESGGYQWSREDIDSEKTVRTKDGRLRRDKIGEKRKLSYSMKPMSRKLLAQLDDDLRGDTFSATYLDLHGEMTREFYCSSFPSNLVTVYEDGAELWAGASFHLIEV